MSGTKITTKMQYTTTQAIANLRSYQQESNGNQNDISTYVTITLDGTGTVGQLIIGSDQNGDVLFNSVCIKARSGGGIDFFNGIGTKIASLDINGNLKCRGSITGNTTP